MKKRCFRWYWVWNWEKEEAWLNEMSAQGWQLVQVGFCCYTFEKGEAGEYCYQLELLEDTPWAAKSQAYLSFLNETGIQWVGSMLRWVYLRQPAAKGPFALYGGLDSKIAFLRRVSWLIWSAFFINLFPLALNLGVNLTHLLTGQPFYLFNLFCGLASLVLCGLLGRALWGIRRRQERLKQERLLHE